MDTDDLSEETYKAVLITGEKFHPDLTLQFGLLADECDSDDNYLEKANQLILTWKADSASSLEDIFFDDIPKVAAFEKALAEIQVEIGKVSSIPVGKRTFTLWEE